jgi:hypothetical protein
VADVLMAKRRESIAQLDVLLQSTFLDIFGDLCRKQKIERNVLLNK